jgi:hypothetical protein
MTSQDNVTPENASQDAEFELSLWDALLLARITANTPVRLAVTDALAADIVLGTVAATGPVEGGHAA